MRRWLFWTLLTLISWGIWAVLSKGVSGLSELHIQALSTVGLIPIITAVWAARDSSTAGNTRSGILLALFAGLFSSLGNIAYYEALSHGKAATIVPLTALSPVVTILLAIPVLGERFNFVQLGGICASILAIFLFNYSGDPVAGLSGASISSWLPMALIAIGLWGVTGLLQKISTNHISASSSAFWFLAAFFPVAGAILMYTPLPSDVPVRTWSIVIALGFMLALGNLTILLAFASGGKASIISPLAGLYPVVSIPIALAMFPGEKLNEREMAGIALALVAVVMLSYQSAPGNLPSEAVNQE